MLKHPPRRLPIGHRQTRADQDHRGQFEGVEVTSKLPAGRDREREEQGFRRRAQLKIPWTLIAIEEKQRPAKRIEDVRLSTERWKNQPGHDPTGNQNQESAPGEQGQPPELADATRRRRL